MVVRNRWRDPPQRHAEPRRALVREFEPVSTLTYSNVAMMRRQGWRKRLSADLAVPFARVQLAPLTSAVKPSGNGLFLSAALQLRGASHRSRPISRPV
jgi:hypothetical protein